MKNTKKKLALMAATLIGIGCIWCGNAVIKASAETITLDDVTFQMVEGASVRKNELEKSGIRFTSYMTASDYSDLMNSDAYEKVEYGMLIAPVDYVDDGVDYELTEDNVFGANAKYYFNDYEGDKTNKKEIINVYADEMTDYTFENDSTVYKAFNGVMINVKPQNYLREFVGVGYIKATKTDGSVKYKFPSTDWKLNQRSVVYISQIALEKPETDTYGTLTTYVNAAKDVDVNYTVKHYKQEDNGEYTLAETENELSAKIGSMITAQAKNYNGYTFDETVEGTKMTSTVYANGKTELALYYKKDAPVEIATAAEFMEKLAANPSGNYKLTEDIDLSAIGLTRNKCHGASLDSTIKNSHALDGSAALYSYLDTFSGTLDGNGKKLTLNMKLTDYHGGAGLFNYLTETGVIKNVNIQATATAYGSFANGNKPYTAGLIYWNKGTIENCYINSTMSLTYGNTSVGAANAALILVQEGTIKNSLVEYNATGETRAIFVGGTGSYENVVAISSQPRFATNGFAGADYSGATPYTAYVYSDYSEMIAGNGKYFTTNTTGAATTVQAFNNLDNTVFTTTAQNEVLFYDTVIATYSIFETVSTAEEFMTKLAANPSGNYKLTEDIDLSAIGLTKYNDKGSVYADEIKKVHASNGTGQVSTYLDAFSGVLNGNGKKLTLNNSTTKDSLFNVMGLFNCVEETGVIKNLYIDTTVQTYAKLGGAGNMPCTASFINWNKGTIDNCYIKSVIRLSNVQADENTHRAALIFQQNGTVKNTVIDYVVYNGTTTTTVATRAIFMGVTGSYENVIAISSQPRFATNYLAGADYSGATPYTAYVYSDYSEMIAGNGKYFTTNTTGAATTVQAFNNLTNALWKNDNGTLYFGTFALNA